MKAQAIVDYRAKHGSFKRLDEIKQVQEKVASQLSTLPMLQGAQVAVAGTDVKGVGDTLDASFKFRFGVLSK